MKHNSTKKLFVYGSLRAGAGHRMGDFLRQHARSLGQAHLAKAALYRVGRYPGLVVGAGASGQVVGEVYELADPEAVLSALDRYEGCRPLAPTKSEFVRKPRTVRLGRRRAARAWVYEYNRATTGLPLIASGDYLAAK